jgi:hypothetical protein
LATLSIGNNKLGFKDTWNISLFPGVDCRPDAPCNTYFKARHQEHYNFWKDDGCYATKLWVRSHQAQACWARNSWEARTDRMSYFHSIIHHLLSHPRPYFRWHIAGDILDQDYLNIMEEVAGTFPEVNFLAMTKMHHLDYSFMPTNLSILWSAWPKWEIPTSPKGIYIAYMQNGKEARIGEKSFTCPGSCVNCKFCWSPDRDLVLHKH